MQQESRKTPKIPNVPKPRLDTHTGDPLIKLVVNAVIRSVTSQWLAKWETKEELEKAILFTAEIKLKVIVDDVNLAIKENMTKIVDYLFNARQHKNKITSLQESPMKLSNLVPGAKTEPIKEPVAWEGSSSSRMKDTAKKYVLGLLEGYSIQPNEQTQSYIDELTGYFESYYESGFDAGYLEGQETADNRR